MRIHIVEDDYAVRDALIELVSGFGHPVLAYGDGEAFMLGCSPRPGDVVFVDLGLPGIGGVDVIRWLRKFDTPPRIVAISGRSRADIEAMLRGMPGELLLLRKPIAPEAVAAVI
ncbi:MAG: response regulator [Microvirga sp.]|nr:response regulator [Microvirga sp.]